jgi:ribosomal protein S18 acetylase RimI-like enzyme
MVATIATMAAAVCDERSGAQLVPLDAAGFATLERIARQIWNEHYITIISQAQIDYMLAGRYTAENLSRYVNSNERWCYLLEHEGERVGYCSYSLTDQPGELKLEQLYVLPAHHGKGLGGFMLRHVEARASELGCNRIMLTVNKHNTGSLAVYRHSGFTVREEAVFDIGNGYVMDDYVMEKRLDH